VGSTFSEKRLRRALRLPHPRRGPSDDPIRTSTQAGTPAPHARPSQQVRRDRARWCQANQDGGQVATRPGARSRRPSRRTARTREARGRSRTISVPRPPGSSPHRRRIGTFTRSQGSAATRWLGPGDVERDTRFQLATFNLETLLRPQRPTTLPSHSSHLSVPRRPKTLHIVTLEVGFEVGHFRVRCPAPDPAACRVDRVLAIDDVQRVAALPRARRQDRHRRAARVRSPDHRSAPRRPRHGRQRSFRVRRALPSRAQPPRPGTIRHDISEERWDHPAHHHDPSDWDAARAAGMCEPIGSAISSPWPAGSHRVAIDVVRRIPPVAVDDPDTPGWVGDCVRRRNGSPPGRRMLDVPRLQLTFTPATPSTTAGCGHPNNPTCPLGHRCWGWNYRFPGTCC
jgi:hypothetical protein